MFLLGRSLSLVPCSFQGVFVSGPMFLPGGLCLGWISLTETPLDRTPHPPPSGQRHPLYGKERAVRVLLDCILVFFIFIADQCEHLIRFSMHPTGSDVTFGFTFAPI